MSNEYPYASMRDSFDLSAYFVVGPEDCKGRPLTDVVDQAPNLARYSVLKQFVAVLQQLYALLQLADELPVLLSCYSLYCLLPALI